MEKVVIGFDGSEAAQAALRWTIEYAKSNGAEIVMAYAVSSVGEWELAAVQIDPDPIRASFAKRLRDEWSEPVRQAGVPCRTKVLVGPTADALMQCARDEHAALITVGMSGHGTVMGLVLGDTPQRLTRHARRPVVVVPPRWSGSREPPAG